MRRLEIHYHVTLLPLGTAPLRGHPLARPSFDCGRVLYVTPIAAINWVLDGAPDSGAFILFGAKSTEEDSKRQR